MFGSIKQLWVRFQRAWESFKFGWNYKPSDFSVSKDQDHSFQITSLGENLRRLASGEEATFTIKPPYFGEPIHSLNGHQHTLKYHYVNQLGQSRYFDTREDRPDYVEVDNVYLDALLERNLIEKHFKAMQEKLDKKQTVKKKQSNKKIAAKKKVRK
jgi:hypothetical protein